MKKHFKALAAAITKHTTLVAIASIAALAAVASCSIEEPDAGKAVGIDYTYPPITAEVGIDNEGTRTFADGERRFLWTADDRVSVFDGTTENLQFTFSGRTGDAEGKLLKVREAGAAGAGGAEAPAPAPALYSLYPYRPETSLSTEGILSVALPDTQPYSPHSFGPEANTMVAISSGRHLSFRNVGGYLVLSLYGDDTVRKVILTSYAGEKIAGPADIALDPEGIPSVAFGPAATSSITLDCGAGVKLGAATTDFWFVIPPVTFSEGFTIQVVTDRGTFARSKITTGTIKRNGIVTTSPIRVTTAAGQYLGRVAPSEIWDYKRILSIAENALKDRGISQTTLRIAFNLFTNAELKVTPIRYSTTDPLGHIVEASGLVAFPTSIPATSFLDRSTSYSKIVGLHHGTCSMDQAPTDGDSFEMLLAFKKGYDVVAMADYLGYGISKTADLLHPMCHHTTTGTTCADLIEAAQDFVTEEGLTRAKSWTIDLVGYSQGAAASISTLLELERRGYTNIGEIHAGDGPHDLKLFLERYTSDPASRFQRTGFIPILFRGLIYGDRLDIDPHRIFAPEYFEKNMDNLVRTEPDYHKFDQILGSDLTKVIHPDFYAPDYNGNQDILDIISALELNSTINYTPANTSKITLYHSPNDNVILYDCSRNAAAKWGCDLIDLEKSDHTDCAIEFYARLLSPTLWDLIKDSF